MDKRDDYHLTKSRLYRKILDRMGLEELRKTSDNSAQDEILVLIRAEVNAEVVPLSFAERERSVGRLLPCLQCCWCKPCNGGGTARL
jgi:hypothetical protein